MTHTDKQKSYSEKLKDPRWQKKRLEVLDRDGFKCHFCKDEKSTLHVHHKKYNGDPWEALNEDLETLCEHCHALIEWLKKNDGSIPEYITAIEKLYFNPFYKFFVGTYDTIFMYELYPPNAFSLINNVATPDLNIIAQMIKEAEEHESNA